MKEGIAEFKTNLGYTLGLQVYRLQCLSGIHRALGFIPSIPLVDEGAAWQQSQHLIGRGRSPRAPLPMVVNLKLNKKEKEKKDRKVKRDQYFFSAHCRRTDGICQQARKIALPRENRLVS